MTNGIENESSILVTRRIAVQCLARLAIVTMAIGLAPMVAKAGYAGEPETVMITMHAKPGAEASLARVIERHWEAVRRLNMVIDGPHVTLKGTENGDKTYFVEIMVWRDASLPDNAPPEILTIWKELNDLVEPRNSQPGLDIREVALLGR